MPPEVQSREPRVAELRGDAVALSGGWLRTFTQPHRAALHDIRHALMRLI